MSSAPIIAFMAYVGTAKLVIVTVPSVDRITNKGIDLHDASVYVSTNGSLEEIVNPAYDKYDSDPRLFSAAWTTKHQSLLVSSDEGLNHTYNAMLNEPTHWYWVGDGKTTELRALNYEHFDIKVGDDGKLHGITSKERTVVYAGRNSHETVIITMIGEDRTSAELYLSNGKHVAYRHAVEAVFVCDEGDPLWYGIAFGSGLSFAYGKAEEFREGAYKSMREAGTSRREAKNMIKSLSKQNVPEKGYFGSFNGGLDTIEDLSAFKLDQDNGLITIA